MKTIGGLSRTSKMPWYSWSISAEGCITGAKLRKIEGSTCSQCYALKGMYRFQNVKDAMARRETAMVDPRFVDAFALVLNTLQARSRTRAHSFRWMDAGDIRSLEHLEQINEIALRTPKIEHWLPTREHLFVRRFLEKHGGFSPNLTVRISAPMIGQRPNRQPYGLPFSGVDVHAADVHPCPASSQGNECGDCRACWTPANISYHQH